MDVTLDQTVFGAFTDGGDSQIWVVPVVERQNGDIVGIPLEQAEVLEPLFPTAADIVDNQIDATPGKAAGAAGNTIRRYQGTS